MFGFSSFSENPFSALAGSVGQTLVQTARFDNTNALYSATIVRGAVNLAPALYTNTNAFYSATITRGAVNLSANLYTNTNAFYAATISQAGAAQTLLPNRFDNTNAFYTATIVQAGGAQTLVQDTRYNNVNVFYTATISSGAILAGGGGDDERTTKGQRKKKRKVVYQVDNRLFETASDAAAYAASLEPQSVETATDTPEQRSILSTVKIDDRELDVETVIPTKATKEFVADLVRAEMKKALRQLKLTNDREELEVVTIIAQMLFGDDVTIYRDAVPPAAKFG